MMFIGTETLVTQLVYERSRMHAPSAPIIVRMPVRERGREREGERVRGEGGGEEGRDGEREKGTRDGREGCMEGEIIR